MDIGTNLFERTVPRGLVHRASVSEVLLTCAEPDAEQNTFFAAAQWSRSHSFYRPTEGLHDPFLVLETIRQTGLIIGHIGYDMPRDHSFIMQGLSYEMDRQGVEPGPRPTDIVVTATSREIRRRGSKVTGLDIDMVLRHESAVVATGVGRLDCVSPGVYRRIRGDAPSSATPGVITPLRPVPPRLVGRSSPEDVTLSDTDVKNTWLLRSVPSHPVLFDHPVDHVPGMLILEAARQAVHRMASPHPVLVVGLDATFFRYAELHLPTVVRAYQQARLPDGTVPTSVEITQHNEPIAVVLLKLTPLSGR